MLLKIILSLREHLLHGPFIDRRHYKIPWFGLSSQWAVLQMIKLWWVSAITLWTLKQGFITRKNGHFICICVHRLWIIDVVLVTAKEQRAFLFNARISHRGDRERERDSCLIQPILWLLFHKTTKHMLLSLSSKTQSSQLDSMSYLNDRRGLSCVNWTLHLFNQLCKSPLNHA